ncbi:MAG: glycoside hydrolase family 28 protein [Bacteroides sp.]|nr:glycoside hydrolase family 28 protein [Bacteroides sp.]
MIRKTLTVLGLLLCTVSCTQKPDVMTEAFAQAEAIVNAIKQPVFPDSTFLITDFGAVEGDSTALYHESINNAILACHNAGGGKVVVPQGTFYTGPITLLSHVNLHIEKGATLKFSTNPTDYFPAVLSRWEGIDCYNAHPLIYAYQAENIALTGEGTLDGQGSKTDWWYMKGGRHTIEGMPDQITSGGRARLFGAAENGIPVEERIMTPADALRPPFVSFMNCTSALIEGVYITNSPFWVIHPIFCQDLIVRGVRINSHGPNNDGCDPESCKNVLIENCVFDTGDDCIAIKSGRNNDGRKWNIPSENIVVRRCQMKDGHGGVVVGSEISGGYRNLYVEDCEMDSPNLDRVVRIKTNACRGGVIENLFVRNVHVNECNEAVMRINLLYEPNEDCNAAFPPVVRNVYLSNVTSQKSKYGIIIDGFEDKANVYNIHVTDCEFNNVSKGNTRISGMTENICLDNLKINGEVVALQ